MALRPTAERFALFYGVWLLLSEMRVEFLLPGLLAAALAAGISGRIWRTGGKRLRVTALPLYLPGFLWRSLKGGVDVAWRVLHPRLPIAPAFMRHHCRETDETARVLFCDAMTLMPGSLGIRLEGYDLDLHLLSDEAHLRRGIEAEEQRMLDLFRSPAVRRNPPTRGGTRA
jgi:multicomponent Na+:H+ antiporter subunit E